MISNHYWIIGGSSTEVYSSATNTMVPVDDADYVAWAAINLTTQIANEGDLASVLQAHGTALPAWMFEADSFIQPTPDTYSQDQLGAYTTYSRWVKEQGGITTTAGMPILTDDRSQAKINGARLVSEGRSDLTTSWHAADGSFNDMTSADIIAMSDDLQTHVNNCFAISSDVHAQIAFGAVTTLEQIDAAFAASMTRARKDWLKKK